MKFGYNTSFTRSKQFQRSRTVYKRDLDFWDCFERKKIRFITEEIQYKCICWVTDARYTVKELTDMSGFIFNFKLRIFRILEV